MGYNTPMRAALKFLQEVKAEFRNISWPKKDALIQLTFVVISISIIISLILGGFDLLFTSSINLLTQSNSQIQKPIVEPIVTIAPTQKVIPTIIKKK
jgi:preprotein translocase SecE subunit